MLINAREKLNNIMSNKFIELNRNEIERYKLKMAEFKVSSGRVQKAIDRPEQILNEMQDAELYVFTEGLYDIIKVESLKPDKYFTTTEIKDYRSTFEGYVSDSITFPHTFDNAHQVNDEYIAFVDISTLRRLDNGGQVRYNPNTQRSGKEVNGIFEADINKRHVQQMRELLRKQELESSLLVFNARRDTADDIEAGEIIYDADYNKLTITKGTFFDCIDGYHRFLALINEQANNPSIEMQVPIKIKNTSEKGAQRAFTQINTYHPIVKSHKRKMDENDLGAEVIRRVLEDSQLRGKVVKNAQFNASNTLASFATLADAVDKSFKLNDRSDAKHAADYLTVAIDEVMFAFPELMGDFNPIREKNLLFKSAFWTALFNLVGKYKSEGLKNKDVTKLIKDIDFSYDNPLWEDLGIIVDNGVFQSADILLTKYFDELSDKANQPA